MNDGHRSIQPSAASRTTVHRRGNLHLSELCDAAAFFHRMGQIRVCRSQTSRRARERVKSEADQVVRKLRAHPSYSSIVIVSDAVMLSSSLTFSPTTCRDFELIPTQVVNLCFQVCRCGLTLSRAAELCFWSHRSGGAFGKPI